ncbi:MAG: hypothetical protein HN350_14780 [Phycisphaerales bacterium]|jgi:hypothetical protein|nr:hypothetical protein [Phycisphaerales bacterium]
MTESQEEIQVEQAPPVDDQQTTLDTLRAENDGLKTRLAEAQQAADNRQDSDAILRDAQNENLQLRTKLTAAARGDAIGRAAEQLGVPAAMARMHVHKFTCELDADGQATITPDPVEFFQAELKRDPTLQAAVDALAVSRRSSDAASGTVELDSVNPVELLVSLDRNPARKTRFIARHGVKTYLELCDRARRC